jgi:hypothetical protein
MTLLLYPSVWELCLNGLGLIILMMSQQCGSGRGKATLEHDGLLFAYHGWKCTKDRS